MSPAIPAATVKLLQRFDDVTGRLILRTLLKIGTPTLDMTYILS